MPFADSVFTNSNLGIRFENQRNPCAHKLVLKSVKLEDPDLSGDYRLKRSLTSNRLARQLLPRSFDHQINMGFLFWKKF